MDSRPRHIPPSEWSRWKDTILALRRGKTLKEVMSLMRDVHGFSASQSQYETQLNVWKNRKNLKADEWAEILMIIDKLDSRYENCRVLISGHPITARRLDRVRRHCVAKLGGAKCGRAAVTRERRSGNFQNVSIETLAADGRWAAYTYLDEINVSDHSHNQTDNGIHLPISPVNDSGPSGSAIPDNGVWQDRHMDDELTVFNIETTFPQSGFLRNFDSQVFGGEIVGEESLPSPTRGLLPSSPSMAMIQSPSQWEVSNFGDIDFGSSNWDSTGWVEAPNYQYFWTTTDLRNNLPFKRFREDLVIYQSRSSKMAGVHLVSTAQTPVTLFLEDLRSSMSEGNKNRGDRWPIYAKHLLSSLETLLPDGKLQPGYDSRQGLITEDEIFQTKFNQLLVFSIANNFAGLQGVPIASMLKYWSRAGGMVSLLLQSLQASQSHFAKALAQNLFRAAIEANDERVLKSLLSIGSLEVNTTMCIINGEKLTPVERAAYLQERGIVELLLIAKADVNKKFREGAIETYYPRSLYSRGALINFISGCRTATSEAFELAKLLLRAGAQVNVSVAEHALGLLNHRDMVYLIVSSVSDSDHAELMGSQLLTYIALRLSDRQATEVTNKLILACQRTKCGRCLSQFQGQMDSALVQGAKHGHSQLVGLLLRYSTTAHRALSAAIQCGKREIIDTILTLKPDMDAPAHSICLPRLIKAQVWDCYEDEDGETTSLAEAIKSRDESLIRMMEDAGSLAHLNEGGRFQSAITAASKTSNAIYVQKLLEHCPSPKPSHMTKAVLHAIRNNHEQIFRTLLAAGAEVNPKGDYVKSLNLLHTAMVCRNSYMVRELLNANIKPSSLIQAGVFREAIEWGDKSIIEDLQSTFPGTQLSGVELSKTLEQGHMEWFEFLLSSRMFSGNALAECLNVAIERSDERLFGDLIKRGANPIKDSILQHCARSRPEMLPLLLEQHPSRNSDCVVPDFGASALKEVIQQSLDGLEAVNILLGCKLVDTESFAHTDESPLGLAITVSQNGNHANFAVIRKLLDSGCDPNCIAVRSDFPTGFNETGFLRAIWTKSKDLVQLMIDHGADVNRKATMGLKRTPLQKAAEVNSLELVTLLLGANADANDKPATRGGGTALQLAAIQGNCNIAAKLLECGADLSAPPAVVNGRWPLEGAAEHGRLDMIDFLWKNKLAGFGVAGFDEKQCRRAMELAEENGHNPCRDLIAELSQASASANVLDVEWRGSPLGFA